MHFEHAVKELVENALDAGATNVTVQCKDFGLTEFTVVDNGSGIAQCDRDRLCKPSFTSKVTANEGREEEEIGSRLQGGIFWERNLYGFRGEALANIAMNCKVLEIATRVKMEHELGVKMVYRAEPCEEEGHAAAVNRVSMDPQACDVGTTVRVCNFLHKLPVRRSDWKRHARKLYNAVKEMMREYSLVWPSVRLALRNNGSSDFNKMLAPLHPDLSQIVAHVFSPTHRLATKVVAQHVVEALPSENDRLQVPKEFSFEAVLVTRNDLAEDVKHKRFYYFVNKRPVDKIDFLHRIIHQLYRDNLGMSNIFAMIHLTLPVESFDINMEPHKRKVELADRDFIEFEIRQRLEKFFRQEKAAYEQRSNQLRASKSTSSPSRQTVLNSQHKVSPSTSSRVLSQRTPPRSASRSMAAATSTPPPLPPYGHAQEQITPSPPSSILFPTSRHHNSSSTSTSPHSTSPRLGSLQEFLLTERSGEANKVPNPPLTVHNTGAGERERQTRQRRRESVASPKPKRQKRTESIEEEFDQDSIDFADDDFFNEMDIDLSPTTRPSTTTAVAAPSPAATAAPLTTTIIVNDDDDHGSAKIVGEKHKTVTVQIDRLNIRRRAVERLRKKFSPHVNADASTLDVEWVNPQMREKESETTNQTDSTTPTFEVIKRDVKQGLISPVALLHRRRVGASHPSRDDQPVAIVHWRPPRDYKQDISLTTTTQCENAIPQNEDRYKEKLLLFDMIGCEVLMHQTRIKYEHSFQRKIQQLSAPIPLTTEIGFTQPELDLLGMPYMEPILLANGFTVQKDDDESHGLQLTGIIPEESIEGYGMHDLLSMAQKLVVFNQYMIYMMNKMTDGPEITTSFKTEFCSNGIGSVRTKTLLNHINRSAERFIMNKRCPDMNSKESRARPAPTFLLCDVLHLLESFTAYKSPLHSFYHRHNIQSIDRSDLEPINAVFSPFVQLG